MNQRPNMFITNRTAISNFCSALTVSMYWWLCYITEAEDSEWTINSNNISEETKFNNE